MVVKVPARKSLKYDIFFTFMVVFVVFTFEVVFSFG